MILDASQSAGVLPIDCGRLHSLAALCCPGHKALYGPQGTGILLVRSDSLREPLMTGGTGSLSEQLEQPAMLPDRFESGTPNAHGIAGLAAGIRWVRARGTNRILTHEQRLITRLAKGLHAMPAVEAFTGPAQIGVLSFRVQGLPCEEVAQRLSDRGVCVRDGLHCAPEAHRSAGTFDTGTVRVSVGAFNSEPECVRFLELLEDALLG